MKISAIPKKLFDLCMAGMGYHKSKKGYQDSRFPQDQYDLICKTDEYKSAQNSLEVGCNQGKLVQLFGNDGIFAVGVDLKPHWDQLENNKAILGAHPISLDEVKKIPSFDIICLLSVHHQWIFNNGDDYTKKLVEELLKKSNKSLYIEFAALSGKYGYEDSEHFTDNVETTIQKYAENWLRYLANDNSLVFLGKTREVDTTEPFRYMYQIKK